MKNPIILLTITALLFAGCGNKKSSEHSHDGEAAHEHTEGTHGHEDGSVHEDHANAKPKQEEFKVDDDSTSQEAEEHGHDHEDGHQH